MTRGGSCDHDEYGDPTDVMGRRNYLFSSFFLERLRWLDESNVLVLDESRRVRISPLEVETSGVQSLRVARSGESGAEAFYHLEYRQPLGEFDSGLEDGLTNGVLVRLVGDPAQRGTPRLLDMTPGSIGGSNDTLDATLGQGSSFQDGNLDVSVVEVTPECITVDVAFDGVPPDPSDPVGSCGEEDDGDVDGTGGEGGAGSDGAGGSTGGADAGSSTGGGGTMGEPPEDVMPPASSTDDPEAGCSCGTAPGRGTHPTALLGLLLLPMLARRWRRDVTGRAAAKTQI